jgi:hypothetical protein
VDSCKAGNLAVVVARPSSGRSRKKTCLNSLILLSLFRIRVDTDPSRETKLFLNEIFISHTIFCFTFICISIPSYRECVYWVGYLVIFITYLEHTNFSPGFLIRIVRKKDLYRPKIGLGYQTKNSDILKKLDPSP